MSAAPRPRLVALVVTFNRLDQIRKTVERLLSGPVDHVVVVDNGSEDGTRDWLAAHEDGRLLPLLAERNLGGAGGFEWAMRRAVEAHDPDWVVLMDDDARPEPEALERFLARDLEGIDALAAAVFYPSGEICEMNRPALDPFRQPVTFLRTLMGGGRMGFHLPDRAYDGPGRDAHVASFVGLFLSRRAMREAGYPDGRLFLYGDDSIYTLRMTKRGLRLRFAPDIRFEHECSTFESSRRVYRPLWKVYYNYRNGLILYRETAGALFWLVILIVVPKWAMNGLYYGSDRREFFRHLRHAVRDGLRGYDGLADDRPPRTDDGNGP